MEPILHIKPTDMYYAIGIFIFLLIFYLIVKAPLIVIGHWHHGFADFEYSPNDFYIHAEEAIQKHEVPGLDYSRVTHYESSILYGRREYLRIRCDNYVFDICASPFGTGFFVSWWFIEKQSLFKRLAKRFPSLEFLNLKTFYQIDTDTMYKEYMHKGLLEAIDQMTNAKGARALSELERQITDVRK